MYEKLRNIPNFMAKIYKSRHFITTATLTTLNKCPYLPSSTPILSIISLKTTTCIPYSVKRVKKAILAFGGYWNFPYICVIEHKYYTLWVTT